MRTNRVLATAVVVMSVSAAAAAQSAKAMNQPAKGDMMNSTYTGCVETFNHGAAFLLTRVDSAAAGATHGDTAMKHDDMVTTLTLAGATNLRKHLGQKVSVTGSVSGGSIGTMPQDLPTLTIKTLKVVARSCS